MITKEYRLNRSRFHEELSDFLPFLFWLGFRLAPFGLPAIEISYYALIYKIPKPKKTKLNRSIPFGELLDVHVHVIPLRT